MVAMGSQKVDQRGGRESDQQDHGSYFRTGLQVNAKRFLGKFKLCRLCH